jgi:hypothetical protein
VNEILKKYLQEVSQLGDEDEQIFGMCQNDLRNYIAYLERKFPEDNSQAFYTYLRGRVLGEFWEEYSDEDMERVLDEFMKDWCLIWYKKFQTRTELALGVKSEVPKASLDNALKGRNVLVAYWTKEERVELEEYLMDIFYDAGEYCFTSNLAHAVIEQYLGRDTWQEKKAFTQADKLEFMHVAGTEARRMAQTRGKLIFIRTDFKKYLREWRNDNTASSTI